MYQGVTLGGTGKQRGKRHPTVGERASSASAPKSLGAVTIGEGRARSAAVRWSCKDVPPHTTAVGMPARAVSWSDPQSGETRPLERLPDPQRDALMSMMQRIEELEERVRELEREQAEHEAVAHAC